AGASLFALAVIFSPFIEQQRWPFLDIALSKDAPSPPAVMAYNFTVLQFILLRSIQIDVARIETVERTQILTPDSRQADESAALKTQNTDLQTNLTAAQKQLSELQAAL